MFNSWMVVLVELIAVSLSSFLVDSPEQPACPSRQHSCTAENEHPKLVRRDGVKVGHVQTIQLLEGNYKKHQLITRSLRPLLFEIPDFLSSVECEHIIKLAASAGLFESRTMDIPEDEKALPLTEEEKQENCKHLFGSDKNGDGKISVSEFSVFIQEAFGMLLSDTDSHAMWQEMNFDIDNDGLISLDECRKGDHGAFDDHMTDIEKNHPRHRTRLSQQTWLTVNGSTDSVLKKLQERVILLTGLPRVFIENSEALQVVQYGQHGHYHAHYDSDSKEEDSTMPCCREGSFNGKCYLCRYMTVLYYLNDVPRGGETAFPVADQEYFNETEHDAKGLSNLSSHCYDSKVVIRPKKGSAVMWYNHVIDNVTGLLGPMDERSLHGGCDVLEGQKWIANNWINAPVTWKNDT